MKCFLCGYHSKTRLPVNDVEIDGLKYSFCKKCLSGINAYTFWVRILRE